MRYMILKWLDIVINIFNTIPRVLYKEPYNQDNLYQGTGINLKTKEASMGGAYVVDGKDK